MNDSNKKKILILDNHVATLKLLSALFESAGTEVKTSSDPDQAVKMAASADKLGEPFDMIVTDIIMPGKNGFEVSKEIRAAGYKGPIIAVTATATGHGKKEGDEAGITSYLGKETLKPELIRALLDAHCSG